MISATQVNLKKLLYKLLILIKFRIYLLFYYV